MNSFKHIQFPTKFIGVILILLSLSHTITSWESHLYNEAEFKQFDDLPLSRSEVRAHLDLGETVKPWLNEGYWTDKGSNTATIRVAGIEGYLQSIKALRKALGDTQTSENNIEDRMVGMTETQLKELFSSRTEAQEAWVVLEYSYRCLCACTKDTSIIDIEGRMTSLREIAARLYPVA